MGQRVAHRHDRIFSSALSQKAKNGSTIHKIQKSRFDDAHPHTSIFCLTKVNVNTNPPSSWARKVKRVRRTMRLMNITKPAKARMGIISCMTGLGIMTSIIITIRRIRNETRTLSCMIIPSESLCWETLMKHKRS